MVGDIKKGRGNNTEILIRIFQYKMCIYLYISGMLVIILNKLYHNYILSFHSVLKMKNKTNFGKVWKSIKSIILDNFLDEISLSYTLIY